MTIRLTLLLAAGLATGPACAVPVLFQAGGATAADVTGVLNAFRAAIPGPNNGGNPGLFAGGRREINWDAVSDALSDPGFLPADQFNGLAAPLARGARFTTPGSGVKTSADSSNPTATPPNFGLAEFTPFSAQRLFAPFGSTETVAQFFVPGSPGQAATVNAFGAIFVGVDEPGSSWIQAFDSQGALLGSVAAPTGAFSFAGLAFGGGERIASVRLVSGSIALDAAGLGDRVALDDFVYAEPLAAVPEPAPVALLLAGLAALALKRRAGP